MKIRKSYIIKIIILMIILIVCIGNIIFVNKKYGIEPKKTYKMNEDVTWNGYTINVKSYEILSEDEAEARYPGSKKILTNEGTSGEGSVLIVKCKLSSDKGAVSLTLGNLKAQGGTWTNGLSRDMNLLINPEFDKLKAGDNEVCLAFEFANVQFVNYNYEEIKNKKYELVVSLTPVISIALE